MDENNALTEIAQQDDEQAALDALVYGEQDAERTEPGERAIASEAETSPASTELVDNFFDVLIEHDGTSESDGLLGEWGAGAADNIGLLHRYVQAHPDALAAVGNARMSAGVWRAALTLARTWEAGQPPTRTLKQVVAKPGPPATERLEMKLEELTARQFEAAAQGNRRLVLALDKAIYEVATAISGDGAIVGGFDPAGGNRTI